MNDRIFRAKTIREALKRVRETLGADAMIVAQSSRDGMIEIVARRDEGELTAAAGPAHSAARAREALTTLGFTSDFVDSALAGATTRSVRDVVAAARRLLPAAPRPTTFGRGRVRFIGPAGAGKTTSIIRFATNHVLAHGRQGIALVTEDTARLGGGESLLLAGELLRVPVFEVRSEEERSAVLAELADRALVLIDTPGRLPRGRAAAGLADLPGFETFLALPATWRDGALARVVAGCRDAQPAGILLTHVDAIERAGDVLSLLWREGIGVCWTGSGVDVTDGLESADSATLWRLTQLGVESAVADATAHDGQSQPSAQTREIAVV